MNNSQEATNRFDKLPPQDLDAERALLAAVLLNSKYLDEVSPILRADDFYLDAHGQVYQAILALAVNGTDGIDPLTVSAELERRGKLSEVGGNEYLTKVIEANQMYWHAKYYAGLIREKAKTRGLIYACTQTLRDAYEAAIPADELLDASASTIQGLMESRTESQAERFSEISLEAMARLEAPRPSGITLGFAEYDELTEGAKPGDLIVPAARPGVGKTAFVGSIVSHVAQFAGVLFASLEMTKAQLFDRALASRLKCSVGELRSMIRDERSERISETMLALSQLNLTIDDSSRQSVSSIAAQARIMKRKHGLGLIVVDYIQLVKPENRRDPREQQVAQISRDLKGLAKSLDVPVIALAQLNREIAKRTNKTPQLTDLRESGAIEQDADVVVFLDRPAMWDPENHSDDEAALIIAKQRGGRTGKIDLKWDGPSMTFRSHSDLDFVDPFNGPGGDSDGVDYQEL